MGRRDGKIQPIGTLLERVMPLHGVHEKLEKAALGWESVVGPVLAKQSAPLDLIKGELLVVAENPLAANRVTMMKGNIARILAERWGLEIVKVKVVAGRLPLKKAGVSSASAPPVPPAVRVREEDVTEFVSSCLETPGFTRDAAESLARLRAFFIKRFPGR